MKIINIYNKLHEEFGKQNWWPVISDNPRFEIIIGAILTQNTSWNNVEKAIKNLKDNNLIGIDKIRKINKTKLAKLIRSSGYFNQKAERLRIIADILSKNNNPTREELLNVKGVGKETADSILLYAYNKPVFVIDAYTKRIMNRLGFKEEGYDDLQELFMNNLPKDYKLFNEFHALLVRLGKGICKKRPKCEACPLNNICPSAFKQ